MSVTYGFYSSLNGDRKYTSEQISAIFDGIISDGVYSTIGSHYIVRAGDGMHVIVGTGRCWFNHTWTLNDSDLPLPIDASDLILNRIDTVVIEVDSRRSSRQNVITVVKGTPSSYPSRPALSTSGPIRQYPLADVRIDAKANIIRASDITNRVGTMDCPFVTGVVTSVTVDEILKQWEAEWNNILIRRSKEWDDWFNQTTLDKNQKLDAYISDTETRIDALLLKANTDIDAYIQFIQDQIASGESTLTEWIAVKQTEFDTWFNGIKDKLSGDVATKLANDVIALQSDISRLDGKWHDLEYERSVYGILFDNTEEPIVDSLGNTIEPRIKFVME